MFESISLFFQTPVVAYIIIAWSLVWKGFALWRAARIKQKYWFVAILVINTAGLLEILYLFIFSKMGRKNES